MMYDEDEHGEESGYSPLEMRPIEKNEGLVIRPYRVIPEDEIEDPDVVLDVNPEDIEGILLERLWVHDVQSKGRIVIRIDEKDYDEIVDWIDYCLSCYDDEGNEDGQDQHHKKKPLPEIVIVFH
jgi:hypothetical protein